MTANQRAKLRALIIDYAMALQLSSDDDGNSKLHEKEKRALSRALDYAETLSARDGITQPE